MTNYWPLLGIALVVLGFALRFNPLLVVAVAAIVTGLLGHMPFLKVLGVLGHGFNENRTVTLIYIVLPVIGLLERYGLQQQARTLIMGMRRATTGRLLIIYMVFRQILAALGLTSVAGQAQTVRPLVAPMALAAAEKEHGPLDEDTAERVKAMSAATDNVGLFFGEDIFIAVVLHPAHSGRTKSVRNRAHAIRAFSMGNPERDLRLPDPRDAAVMAGSLPFSSRE